MNESGQEKPDKSDLIQAMEENMTEGVIEHTQGSDLSEELLGLVVYKVVGEYAKSYKKNDTGLKEEFGYTKHEVHEMVDEASTRVLDKFLENW